MKALVHFLDGVASAVLAMALTQVYLGGGKVFNVLLADGGSALWTYSVAVMLAAAWAIYRVVFKRSPA